MHFHIIVYCNVRINCLRSFILTMIFRNVISNLMRRLCIYFYGLYRLKLSSIVVVWPLNFEIKNADLEIHKLCVQNLKLTIIYREIGDRGREKESNNESEWVKWTLRILPSHLYRQTTNTSALLTRLFQCSFNAQIISTLCLCQRKHWPCTLNISSVYPSII